MKMMRYNCVLKSYCYASLLLMVLSVMATSVPSITDIDNPGLLLSADLNHNINRSDNYKRYIG